MPARERTIAALPRHGVRVFALGRFRVEVDGIPLQFGRKAQRRPMDLLKLLVAYGGEAVPPEQLAEDLWPDSEGDKALAALRTTVSRLRKLIGAGAILSAGNGLSLNPDICWVDASAHSEMLAVCKQDPRECSPEATHSGLEEALALYRGEFLAGEFGLPVALTARKRLHSALLRHLLDLGRRHEQVAQLERAIAVYRRGLEIDGAAENIARRLMECCRNAGRAAEGIATYRSCLASLRARFGVDPSATTQGVYRDLLALAERDALNQRRNGSAIGAEVSNAGAETLSIVVLPFADLSTSGSRRGTRRARHSPRTRN